MSQTVLILGGGVGGLVVANQLRKALPKEHRIVVVEREAFFSFAPSFLWLMTGARTAGKISRPLARLKKRESSSSAVRSSESTPPSAKPS